MKIPVGMLRFTANCRELSPFFTQLSTEKKQFSVDGRLFHEFDLSSLRYPVELECLFESDEPFASGPCSDENLIAVLHSNENFALAIGFACDYLQVFPEYRGNQLLPRINDPNLKTITCRIAWLIGSENESRDTMVELAADSY